MFVAGIDAHATYSVLCVVSNGGQLVHGPVRIKNTEADQLTGLLMSRASSCRSVLDHPRWYPAHWGNMRALDSGGLIRVRTRTARTYRGSSYPVSREDESSPSPLLSARCLIPRSIFASMIPWPKPATASMNGLGMTARSRYASSIPRVPDGRPGHPSATLPRTTRRV